MPPNICVSSSTYQRQVNSVVRVGKLLRHATSSAQVSIPPESPKFIDIPQPPQQQARITRPIKGVLPAPRQLFSRKNVDKTSAEYLAATTQEPTITENVKPIDASTAGYVTWKARSAERRRQNLREGLIELHHRKQVMDQRRRARSAFKRAESERAVRQPIREDEQLTSPTISELMTPACLANVPDPNQQRRIARMRKNVENKEKWKIDERRNALHSLYMNARDFIVTEAALNARVDEVFDEEWFKVNEGRSIWDREKGQDTVRELLRDATRNGTKAGVNDAGYTSTTMKRVRRIGEELTGGKI
ncbi:hypothetical protein MMC14_001243 [Varicellaria rhodocarpa]|nr:hypothetical protein [Varicellaria rhodocarpa]